MSGIDTSPNASEHAIIAACWRHTRPSLEQTLMTRPIPHAMDATARAWQGAARLLPYRGGAIALLAAFAAQFFAFASGWDLALLVTIGMPLAYVWLVWAFMRRATSVGSLLGAVAWPILLILIMGLNWALVSSLHTWWSGDARIQNQGSLGAIYGLFYQVVAPIVCLVFCIGMLASRRSGR